MDMLLSTCRNKGIGLETMMSSCDTIPAYKGNDFGLEARGFSKDAMDGIYDALEFLYGPSRDVLWSLGNLSCGLGDTSGAFQLWDSSIGSNKLTIPQYFQIQAFLDSHYKRFAETSDVAQKIEEINLVINRIRADCESIMNFFDQEQVYSFSQRFEGGAQRKIMQGITRAAAVSLDAIILQDIIGFADLLGAEALPCLIPEIIICTGKFELEGYKDCLRKGIDAVKQREVKQLVDGYIGYSRGVRDSIMKGIGLAISKSYLFNDRSLIRENARQYALAFNQPKVHELSSFAVDSFESIMGIIIYIPIFEEGIGNYQTRLREIADALNQQEVHDIEQNYNGQTRSIFISELVVLAGRTQSKEKVAAAASTLNSSGVQDYVWEYTKPRYTQTLVEDNTFMKKRHITESDLYLREKAKIVCNVFS